MRLELTRRSWWLPLFALGIGCSSEQAAPGPAPSPAGAAGSSASPAVQAPGPSSPAGASSGAPNTAMSPAGPTNGADPAAPAANPPVNTTTPPVVNGPPSHAANAMITEDCQGFKLEGLLYSPGGAVLPNKCMPYHPTTNNPYAVRCVDAWPWYKTSFPGDVYCILPPPPDKGVQYGVHPQGQQWFEQVSKGDLSGYENLSEEWTMKDGEEETVNYETKATNPSDAKYYRSYTRMRPGSHHMIVNLAHAHLDRSRSACASLGQKW